MPRRGPSAYAPSGIGSRAMGTPSNLSGRSGRNDVVPNFAAGADRDLRAGSCPDPLGHVASSRAVVLWTAAGGDVLCLSGARRCAVADYRGRRGAAADGDAGAGEYEASRPPSQREKENMNSKWRTIVFFIAAAGFSCLYFLGVKNLPPWGHYRGPYGDLISAVGVYERHATDAVNAIDYDYRGFDTLGEEFIRFTSVLGVMMLLREMKRPPKTSPPDKGLSDAVKASAGAGFAALLIFGIYMTTHGQLTPGGGFQGGVIVASASMLVYIAENFPVYKQITSHPLVEILESLGAGFYVIIGL